MFTKTIHGSAVVMLALSALPACITGEVAIGEDEQLLVTDRPEPAGGCAGFCDGARELGCPPTDDCMTVCDQQRAEEPTCGDELDEVLACAADELFPGSCSFPGASAIQQEEGTCGYAMMRYGVCLHAAAENDRDGFACDERSSTAEYDAQGRLVEAAFEMMGCDLTVGLEVDLRARCRDGGVCTCSVGHEAVHTCQNLVHAEGLTRSSGGCCDRYFEATFGGLFDASVPVPW